MFCDFLQETLCEFRADNRILQISDKGEKKNHWVKIDPLKCFNFAEPLSLTTEAQYLRL